MKLKHFSWLPAVIIMGIIFCFSSKPAEVSGENSLAISRTIIKIYEQATATPIEAPEMTRTLDRVDHIVRKTAHFMEYAVLAAAIALHFTLWKEGRGWRLGMPVLITALYAATDEFHQTFVPGRSGQFSDVVLDSCGAVAGVIFFAIFLYIAEKQWGKLVQKTKQRS